MKSFFINLYYDAKNIALKDPAAKSIIYVILLYPGFHALFAYRIAHMLSNKHLYFVARLISQFTRFLTGIMSDNCNCERSLAA